MNKAWFLIGTGYSQKRVIGLSIMESEEQREALFQSTCRQATYLWVGLLLAMTLFYAQSQIVFIKEGPNGASPFEWPLIFLGALTFWVGLYFFKNYTKVRARALGKAEYGDRKQTLLVAFVFQFILFETLGLYGVILSVLTQNSWKALPFVFASYLGFLVAFPRRKVIAPFFGGA